MNRARILVVLLVISSEVLCKTEKTRNVVVTAEEEKVRDAAGYAAIAEIHREMDDDHSGSIDRKETTGFMTEDMHMRSSDRQRREHHFHGDDDAITIDDLWEAWFESDERAWTNAEVLNWMVHEMNLPMYADRITKSKVDGRILPRLAVHNSSYMSQVLGIKSSVHRQKLRLNALDVVLFGHRESSRMKDAVLAVLIVILTSVVVLSLRQRRRSKAQVSELSDQLTQLKNMESEFEDVQKKWNEERSRSRSTADGAISIAEMESLRVQLQEAERRLEQNGSSGTPLALQPLLRKTCENEMTYLERQRIDCITEMKEAIELVDRLQKKQGSVLTSLKLATGASTSSDQVDSKIFALKQRMEKIHIITRETQERWLQIESLCGFPLLYNGEMIGDPAQFYANNHSGSSSVSSKSIPIPPTSSQSQLLKASGSNAALSHSHSNIPQMVQMHKSASGSASTVTAPPSALQQNTRSAVQQQFATNGYSFDADGTPRGTPSSDGGHSGHSQNSGVHVDDSISVAGHAPSSANGALKKKNRWLAMFKKSKSHGHSAPDLNGNGELSHAMTAVSH